MQITGLIMDAATKTPMDAARVTITREGGGDEIASLSTGDDGRFVFDDDLNEYLGQQLAFTVERRGYRQHRSVHMAERGLTITIQMSRAAKEPPPPAVVGPSLWERLGRWFAGLGRGGRLALVAVPLVVVLALLAWWLYPAARNGDVLACEFGAIRSAATSDDPGLLVRIAEVCEREGKGELRFTAIEQCALREQGPCLMTMARWYDPQFRAEPTPFPRRDGTLAAQYYRRARNQGVEDARARLDALCGSLRQAGGQEAVEAGC